MPNQTHPNTLQLFQDFTEITCALCEATCGRQNCETHRDGCMERNLDTVRKLIAKGWTKDV